MRQDNIIEQAKDLLKEHVGVDLNQKPSVDIEMLCHKVFEKSEDGKKLMQWLMDNYILSSVPSIEGGLLVKYNANYSLYKDGYCDAIKHLIEHAKRYEAKICQEAQ